MKSSDERYRLLLRAGATRAALAIVELLGDGVTVALFALATLDPLLQLGS